MGASATDEREAQVTQLKRKDFVLSPGYIDAAEACPAACVYLAPKQKPNGAMWHGIAIHKYLELALSQGRYAALAYIKRKFPRKYNFCSALDLDSLPEDGVVEPHYLIDTQAQTAYQADDFKDAQVEQHVYVRSDVVFWDKAREQWHTADFKTGAPTEKRPQIDPRTSAQMQTQALAVWLNNGSPAFVGASIINIASNMLPLWRTVSFTADEMHAYAKRLRRVHLTIMETRNDHDDGIEPAFVVSAACGGCKNRDFCDARMAT